MASKTVTCNGTSGSKYNLTLTYWTNSQDIAGNKSNIYVEATLKRNDGYAGSYWNLYENQNSAYIKVGGSTKISRNLKIDTRNSATVTLATWTGDVSHNTDGSLTIALEAGFNTTSSSLSGGTVSVNYTLTTIPRRSDFTLSSTSIEAGNSVTVTITPASNSYTHKVIYTWGSNSSTTTLTTSKVSTYTVPMSWLSAIPNTTSGSMSVAVQTLSGSTVLGTVTKYVTVRCPSSVIPTISSLTTSRINNDVPAAWGVYVKDHSQVNITITGAAGIYGSTIKSYKITGGGFSGTTSNLTTGRLSSAGTITFSGTVTDSRGRVSSTATVSITVQDYNNPTLALTEVYRCDEDGTANDDGNYLAVNPTWGYSSVGGKNTATCTYIIKRADGTNSQTGSLPSGTVTIIPNISSSYTHKLTVTVTDGITSISAAQDVSTADVIMSWKQGGNGMAIGKVAERDGLEIAWPVKLSGGVEIGALSGILKASNGAVSTATSGTDYAAPIRKYTLAPLSPWSLASSASALTLWVIGDMGVIQGRIKTSRAAITSADKICNMPSGIVAKYTVDAAMCTPADAANGARLIQFGANGDLIPFNATYTVDSAYSFILIFEII